MHPALEMTDEERDAFLRERKTMRVASRSPNGFPHNVPVGYAYDGERLYFPSDEDSQKVANLRREPKICCIVDEGTAGEDYETLAGVMVQGETAIFGEDEHPEMTHEVVMDAIFEGGEVKGKEHYERVERVVVEVKPVNVVTWDFSNVYT